MKTLKISSILLISGMLTTSVLAQGISTDSRTRGGAQSEVDAPSGISGGGSVGTNTNTRIDRSGAGASTHTQGTVGSGTGSVGGAAATGVTGGVKR